MDIDETRALYIPVANRAQILFFCLMDMSNVDPMYQYSMDWFVNIFVNSMANTEKTGGEIIFFENFLILNVFLLK